MGAGTGNLFINSDFKDYYDIAAMGSIHNNSGIYNRIMNNVPGKVEELKLLHNLGIKTVPLMAVSKMAPTVKNVVVYTDIKGHRGNGKAVMSLSEADMMYKNKLASEYYEHDEGITYKILTIGKRRFKCILRNIDLVIEHEILSIEELPSGYNYPIGLPIFSIDYVRNHNGEMLAVDFNTIQRLDYLGIPHIMTEEEVVKEVYNALIAYNKI